MRNDLESPKSIYLNVSNEVDSILKKLGSSGDSQVSQAKDSAMKILKGLQDNLNEHIAVLERHAEWDIFTIAFYGETNAGKSTIIETLRIMLGEQSKVKAHQAFKALQDKHGITEENFKALSQSILQGEKLLIKLQEELNDIALLYDTRENALKEGIRYLYCLVYEKKKTASFWKKLLSFFQKLPEEIESENAEINLKAFRAEKSKSIERFKRRQLEVQRRKSAAEQAHNRLVEELQNLEAFADGGIIGNGRSDYTVETQDYIIDSGNQKFILLDMPGIEGKESKVINSIWFAVQKAHAVFYVTGKASAPQKGDDGYKGTLEKIKEHLGSQTEVWTIYNKRITNTIPLEKGELISQDEKHSLQDLDDKMREQLGENYQQVFPLSAQPAFLAVADCLVPGSQDAKNKGKFFSKFTAQELLWKSNALQFYELLTKDLIKNYKIKIKRSNFNKANNVVKVAITEVITIHQEFKPLGQQLKQNAEDTSIQLDIALRALKNRIESQGQLLINRFKNLARKNIYDFIDTDISNDEFKRELQSCIVAEQEILVQRVPQVIDNELKKFQSEISELIERFQRYSTELLKLYGKIQAGALDVKFELKINIDNGLKVQNLLFALVGGVFMFLGTGGWALAFGIVTLLFSFGKAVRGFFSTEYKKAEQRKAADENLKTITEKMGDSMRDNLNVAFPDLEAKVEGIKEILEEGARQVAYINETLVQSVAELTKLSNSIETVGVQ